MIYLGGQTHKESRTHMVNTMMEVFMGYLETGEEKPLIYLGWVRKYFLELVVPELNSKK